MNRNVIKIGPATLVVSLPSSWAKKYSIQKGDEIIVQEQGDTLKLSCQKKSEHLEAFVDVSNPQEVVRHVVSTMYKVGYKKITVQYDPTLKVIDRYKEKLQFDMIQQQSDSHVGMSIVDVKRKGSKGIIEIEERAELEYSEFKKTVDKAFYHLISLSEQVAEAIKSKNDISNEAWMAEHLINKSTDFCMRILNTTGYEDYKKTGLMFYLVNWIEELGDEYYHGYMYFVLNSFPISKLELLKQANDALKMAFRIYKKFDIKELTALNAEVRRLVNEFEKNFNSKMSIKQLRAILFIYSILQRLNHLKEILIALNHEQFAVKS